MLEMQFDRQVENTFNLHNRLNIVKGELFIYSFTGQFICLLAEKEKIDMTSVLKGCFMLRASLVLCQPDI